MGDRAIAWKARFCWCVAALTVVVLVGCTSVGTTGSPSAPLQPTQTRRMRPTGGATATRTRTRGVTPTATAPAVSVTPAMTPTPTPTKELKTVMFNIVYDNNAYDPALRTSWGFSCWVETDEATILFDTGGDGTILLHNLSRLALDPQEIDAVVLSHAHGDHTGGLGAVLSTGVTPTVYVPASFSAAFKNDVGARTDVVEVSRPVPIAPGVHTTGEVKSNVIEQALVVETDEGLVVVTGCAHPGVVDMVRHAKEAVDGEVALVMGGFHLSGASRGQVESIIADLRSLGVRRVAPCHCTGDRARQQFVDAFGEDAVLAGVGWSTEFITGR